MDFLSNYYGIDWLATVLGVLTAYLLGRKQKIGFIIGTLGGLSWLAFGIIAESSATIVANVIFIFLYIKGYIYWKKDHSPTK